MHGADIFGRHKALVGMIHVGALPGTPASSESVGELAERAAAEAQLLASGGFDSVIIENMHDVPYLMREVGPEIVSAMTAIGKAVRDTIDLPIGIQILGGANMAAVAVAHAIGAQFVRAEGFVFASVADEGLMGEADAGPLLRYRRAIGADEVRIIADIKKKHSSHAITSDVSIVDTAHAAEFFRADGLVVTGTATGRAVDLDELRSVRDATKLPLAVGSGATPESLRTLFQIADAVIVGSWYKRDGLWSNEPDESRIRQLVTAADVARS